MYLQFNAGRLPLVTKIGRVDFDKPFKHMDILSDEYVLIVINSGDLYIEEENIKYHLQKGDFFILEPFKTHVAFVKSEADYFFIHFKTEQVRLIDENKDDLDEWFLNNKAADFYDNNYAHHYNFIIPKHYKIEDTNYFYQITSILQAAMIEYTGGKLNYPIVCSARLLEIFINMYRQIVIDREKNDKDVFTKAYVTSLKLKKFIDDNIYRQISKDDIVGQFEFNYDYLNRLFKKYIGYSIQQYNQYQKIETAKMMLSKNEVKVSDVAYLVGIDNPYYFSKIFKKNVGLTPSDYIKMTRLQQQINDLKIHN